MRKKLAVLAGVCVLGLCAGCGQQADGAAQDRGQEQEISEADVSEAENDGEGDQSGDGVLSDEAGGMADEAGAAEKEADSGDAQSADDGGSRDWKAGSRPRL